MRSALRKKCMVPANGRRAVRTKIADSETAAGTPPTLSGCDFTPTIRDHMKTSPRLLVLAAAFATLTAFGADAATNWTDQCAKCHGADGKGDTKMGKKLSIADLSDARVQAGFTDEAIVKAVKVGIKDKGDKLVMKPVEGLTDDEIKALIPVVRSFKK